MKFDLRAALLAAEGTEETADPTLWEEITASLKAFFWDNWLNVVYFILALFIGIFIVKIIMRAVRAVFSRSKMEKITQSFLLSLLKFVLYLILVLILAQIIGIPITGLVALISAAGLAVSLALQDSLSNLANGIIIISTKPFHEGDYVLINGVEGTVKNIRMLTTALVTPDNKLIVLPNSNIVTNEIVNYNVLGRRRVDFTFSVAYETDLKLVREIIYGVFESDGRTLTDPAPVVRLADMGASSIQISARCWCDAEDYWDIYFYVLDRVFNEFKKHGVTIPYNQMEVRMREDKPVSVYDDAPLPARVEKVRGQEAKGDFIDRMEQRLSETQSKKERRRAEKEAKRQKKADESGETPRSDG